MLLADSRVSKAKKVQPEAANSLVITSLRDFKTESPASNWACEAQLPGAAVRVGFPDWVP